MKILWDVRFLSTNYATRGIGVHAIRMIESAYARMPKNQTVIFLGIKSDAPKAWSLWKNRWISYRPRSWKLDCFLLPLIELFYKCDLVHYWAAMGPLTGSGLPLWHRSKSVATVYDVGVALWHEIPFLASRRKSLFWKIQIKALLTVDHIISISESVRSDISTLVPNRADRITTVYVPLSKIYSMPLFAKRSPVILALGGAPNKNLKRVLEAYALAKTSYTRLQIVVCGDLDEDEQEWVESAQGVERASIDTFFKLLPTAAAYMACSLREGLGLPVLDAFAYACPLVVAQIPAFSEIVGGGGVYCNPLDTATIATALRKVLSETEAWSKRSFEAGNRYRALSHDSSFAVWEIYKTLEP